MQDGPEEECELHVVGSGHIFLLVTVSNAAIGGDQVTSCSYSYQTFGCFVEQNELVSGSLKGEELPCELVWHFCYIGGESGFYGLTFLGVVVANGRAVFEDVPKYGLL